MSPQPAKRKTPPGVCPTPWKRRFGDELAAKLALSGLDKKRAPVNATTPVPTYRCGCGGVHLTSKKRRRPTRAR